MKTLALAAAAAVGLLGLPTEGTAQYGGTKADKTIVDVAVENGSFTTLVTAVQEAGLVETLSSEGPFTVFAPTDEAFAKLPAGTLEALLADKDALRAVLTYHVLSGEVKAKQVLDAGHLMPETVQGEKLDVRVADGSVKVNGATVVQPNVEASNGVIHVIDSVVLPPSMQGK